MPVTVTEQPVKNILTRASGFLTTVCSHSLQPYRGCTFGGALCGVGCYVQHNQFILRGRTWGEFLEVRSNAAEVYLATADRERQWARRTRGRFSIFCSSATDPFLPQEQRFRVTSRLLQAMSSIPPDELILQTHTDGVLAELPALLTLQQRCELRVHVSIESDRDRLPGLPPPACSVERRIEACQTLRSAGIYTVVTVAPLLPIAEPTLFFQRLGEVADAVVIDHFIGGDGSATGNRTQKTPLPAQMEEVLPGSTSLSYRDEIVAVARSILPGRVGVHIAGFAGHYE